MKNGLRCLLLLLVAAVSFAGTSEVTLKIAVYHGTVRLGWVRSPGATGFNVYRSTVSKGPYSKVGFTSQPFYMEKLPRTGKYYYVVRVVASGIEGPNSNEVAGAYVYPR